MSILSIYHRLIVVVLFCGIFFCSLSTYVPLARASEDSNKTPISPRRSSFSEFEMAPTVVSATRLEQSITDTIPSVTLISQEQIERSQAVDLPSLLRREAGIEIFQNGGLGSLASMQIRGASATQVLILLDGIEISSASSGFAQIEQITSDQIDHVEIVHGNVSALYGSQAIGGVVRIFTQPNGCHFTDAGDGPLATRMERRARAAVQLGAWRTRSAQAQYAQCGEKTWWSIKGGRRLSDSFPSVNAQQAPNANQNDHGYQNTSLSGELRHALVRGWEGGARVFSSQGVTHFSNPYGSSTDINYAQSKLQNIVLFLNGEITERWHTKLSMAQVDDTNDSYTESALYGGQASRFHTINHKLIFQNEVSWLKTATHHQTTLWGYEHLRQALNSTSYEAPLRKVGAVFIGQQIDFKQHHLQVNLRHDRYSDAGNANTYFLGYAYDWQPLLKSYLNVSSAFRAPTFNELYYPRAGNRALQPERARSVEMGVRYMHDAGEARIALFQTNYHDLVSYVRVGAGPFSTPINTQRAQVSGLELAFSAILGGFNLQANATFQNPKNQTLNAILPSRARHFGNVMLSKKWGKAEMGASLRLAGNRFDITDARDKKWLAGYGVVDVTGRYAIDKQWQLLAKLENLFDRDYQIISRYNTPRRGFYLTLAWQLAH